MVDTAQRWLSIVAFGAVCWAICAALNQWFDLRDVEAGWFNYNDGDGVVISRGSGAVWRALIVWLSGILGWFVVSLRWLRGSPVLESASED